MNPNTERIDEAVLGLLFLTSFKDGDFVRAWKGQDWDVLDRLFEQGWIHDPKGKAKSVVFTDEGWEKSQQLFEKLFTKQDG